MAIDKVKFPNGNTENIQDSRIPGVDSTPTANSVNLVTSGGVKSALDSKMNLGDRLADFNTNLTGNYAIDTNSINGPNINYGQALFLGTATADTTAQLAFNYTSGNAFFRGGHNWGSSWNRWREFAFKDDLSDYLPLSGGTLTGLLCISSGKDSKIILDNTDNETNYQQIGFSQNGTEYARLGTFGDTNLRWQIGNNASYKIWHEGNDGSGSGLDADLLDGLDSDRFLRTFKDVTSDLSTFQSPGVVRFSTNNPGLPSNAYNYGNVLVVRGDGSDTLAQLVFSFAQNGLMAVRSGTTTNIGNKPWRTLACKDDNVASATKLETARTIWGQSFDGTADIDGPIRVLMASDPLLGAVTSKFLSYSPSPYGLIFRAYASGAHSIQVQREANDNEVFPLVLNPRGGNVGVGVPNPAYKFDVAGIIRAEKLIGTATGITETTLENEEFAFQAVPVQGIADGYRIEKVRGNTLAWNQIFGLIPSGTEATYDTDISFTADNNGGITINGTAPSIWAYSRGWRMFQTSGHKYLAHISSSDISTLRLTGRGIGGWSATASRASIFTVTVSGYNSIAIGVEPGTSYDNFKIYPQIFDLTLMFGAGNEPSTVEEFEALFPKAYYDYTAGELINNSAEAIETVGFNQWDGTYKTGLAINASNGNEEEISTLCTNLIRVLPGKSYFINISLLLGSNRYGLAFYDAATNYISGIIESTSVWPNNNIITVPTNAHFLRISYIEGKFLGINLSDPDRNGEYEPYRANRLALGLGSIKVKDSNSNIHEINGLASAGDVYDEIAGGELIQRLGRVDLGRLNWSNMAGVNGKFVAVLSGRKNYGAAITSNRYAVYQGSPADPINFPDKTLVFNNFYKDGGVNIIDSSYTDAASFKAAMSGVMLYYELATPIIYDLVSPVPLSGRIDGNGTMRVISDNIVAPFNGDITYGCNPGQIAADSNALMGYVNSVFDLRYYETSQPSGGMLPNREYKLGTLSSATTFTLAAETSGVTNHYFWTFETGSTAPTITWPAAITSWAGGSAPSINSNRHYEVSVLNGVAVVLEV